MLTDAELDARAELVDELARWAIDRIPTPPRAGRDLDEDERRRLGDGDRPRRRAARARGRSRSASPTTASSARSSARPTPTAPRATWYVDPVDGTTNYVHGLPWSSFSCAVARRRTGTAIGAVADPYRREVLSAVRGRGARRDGEPTRCADANTLVGGIFLTEMTMQWVWDGLPQLMGRLSDAGCVTRIMGSNALSLASVGAGRAAGDADRRVRPDRLPGRDADRRRVGRGRPPGGEDRRLRGARRRRRAARVACGGPRNGS